MKVSGQTQMRKFWNFAEWSGNLVAKSMKMQVLKRPQMGKKFWDFFLLKYKIQMSESDIKIEKSN